MAQALAPLPTFSPGGKGQSPVQRVEVQTQAFITFTLTGTLTGTLAGQEVTLWNYFIRPFYADESLNYTQRGYLGLALFTAQNELIWRSAWEKIDYTSQIMTRLQPITLTPTEQGLLYQRQVLFEGSGGAITEQTTLYHWNKGGFTPVWAGITGESGSMGAGYRRGAGSTVTMQNRAGLEWLELLVQPTRDLFAFNYQVEALTRDYRLTLPGHLTWRWDGERYGLSNFVTAEQMTPIHPAWPVRFAPRVTQDLLIDGIKTDWRQIEYADQGALTVEPNTPSYVEQPHHGLTAAWDATHLYLFTTARLTDTLWFALDRNLGLDFGDQTPSADDFVWAMSFMAAGTAPPTAQFQPLYQTHALPIQVAIAKLPDDLLAYGVEMAIPLPALGLDNGPLAPTGWVSSTRPVGQRTTRLYYPAAGTVIALAVAVVDATTPPAYDFADPTTWPALIFMADR